MSSTLEQALELAATGIPVFPCRSTPEHKPTDKTPACKNGFKDATTDPARIRELFASPHAKLIGVPTGPASGFDYLDLDPRHKSDEWEARYKLPATRIHLTQSGGKHVLFKSNADVRNSQSKIAPGLDVRGKGGFIIWWPAFGCEVWLDTDIAPWPADLLALATAPKPRSPREARINRAVNSPTPDAAKQALADAVKVIEALVEGERHEAIRGICMSIASLVNGDMLDEDDAHDAISEASRVCGSENMDNVEKLWSSALEKASPAKPNTGDELGDMGPLPDETPDELLAKRGGRPLMINRIRLPSQIGNEPARPYIVKKLMRPGDVCAIIGPPGAGKSMLAPLIGYMIAQGKHVFGMKSNPGYVLYLAAEDHDGMGQRIKALEREHGTTDKFGLVDVSNLRHGDEERDLMATIRALEPALVILDTLGAGYAGMAENSPEDMGKVVETARGIAATGACCMLVHHTTKQNDGTARGHSVLQATFDMLILLGDKRDDGIVECTVGKNRAGPSDLDIAFKQHSVTLGLDEDGDTITAPMAVAMPARRPEDRKPEKPLSPSLIAPLRILTNLIAAAGNQPVTYNQWRDECEKDAEMCVGNFRTKLHRAKTSLLGLKMIHIEKDLVRLVQASEVSLADLAATSNRYTPATSVGLKESDFLQRVN